MPGNDNKFGSGGPAGARSRRSGVGVEEVEDGAARPGLAALGDGEGDDVGAVDRVQLGDVLEAAEGVEHGSAQVIPAFEDQPGGVGIGHVLLRIEGSPEEVFNGYVNQIKAKLHGQGLAIDHSTIDGTRSTTARGGGAGGWAYSLTMLSRPGEPAWAELAVTSVH